jgi:hypothetical protein
MLFTTSSLKHESPYHIIQWLKQKLLVSTDDQVLQFTFHNINSMCDRVMSFEDPRILGREAMLSNE